MAKTKDRAMIYEDPITQTKPDEEVTLVKKFQDFSDGLEQWFVRYDGEKALRLRVIKP